MLVKRSLVGPLYLLSRSASSTFPLVSPSFPPFFSSNTSLSCYTNYPVKFPSTVLFAVLISLLFPYLHLFSFLCLSHFGCSLIFMFSLSLTISLTLFLCLNPHSMERQARKDDVWQLLYFDLLSVRLILTQCVSYQRPVECVRCVFIHYSRLGHFSQESDNNWCVDLDRESILVAWNESIWSHLGLSKLSSLSPWGGCKVKPCCSFMGFETPHVSLTSP